MFTEAEIIKNLQSAFPEQIGDDAASMPLSETENYLISKDLLIEDTHFCLSYQTPESLAEKALHVNLSDLAAMGATPRFVLLGISIPPHFKSHTKRFLEAFSKASKAASVILIGGDTTGTSDKLMLSITAIGDAPKAHIKYRTKANPSDILCLAGDIGDAHLGFQALENKVPKLLQYKKAFLNPKARIKEGIWLGKQNAVTSMMDTSDGLWIDLQKLCEASKLACALELEALKPDKAFQAACKLLSLDIITTQLSGGEDYGLLFSVREEAIEALKKQFKQQFKYDLKCIGQFKSGQSVTLCQNKQPISLDIKPFLHFE